MESVTKATSRRNFLKLAAAGAAAAGSSVRIHGGPRTTFLDSEPQSQRPVSANDRIRLGLIGAGGMGFGDTETALRVRGVELVAAADLYDGRLTRVKEVFGKNVMTTRDYREVLARPEVRERFISLGIEVAGGSPEAFAAVIKAEMNSMGKVIKAAGIRAE